MFGRTGIINILSDLGTCALTLIHFILLEGVGFSTNYMVGSDLQEVTV